MYIISLPLMSAEDVVRREKVSQNSEWLNFYNLRTTLQTHIRLVAIGMLFRVASLLVPQISRKKT